LLCKGRGFCGAMGNDVSRVAVVDVCRGSLVRAQVGARRRTEAKLLHIGNRVPFGTHTPNVGADVKNHTREKLGF
jgi:hypothetical protein